MAKATLTTRVTTLEDCYKKVGVNVESLQKTVVGNGKKGLVVDVADIKTSLAFITGKLEGMGVPSRKKIAWQRIKETAIVAAIFAVVLGAILLFLAGKITIDDIARILAARAGG